MLEYLSIGEIVNVHGVKGALKVLPLTDDPSRFHRLKTVRVVRGTSVASYPILHVGGSGSLILLTLEGVDTREKAEGLKGAFLEIPRQEAISLPEDSFFIGDLIGCQVYEMDGTCLGTVKDVLQTGSNDVYQVVDEQGRMLLLPALKQVVREVRIEQGLIRVELLPGLKEIYYEN